MTRTPRSIHPQDITWAERQKAKQAERKQRRACSGVQMRIPSDLYNAIKAGAQEKEIIIADYVQYLFDQEANMDHKHRSPRGGGSPKSDTVYTFQRGEMTKAEMDASILKGIETYFESDQHVHGLLEACKHDKEIMACELAEAMDKVQQLQIEKDSISHHNRMLKTCVSRLEAEVAQLKRRLATAIQVLDGTQWTKGTTTSQAE